MFVTISENYVLSVLNNYDFNHFIKKRVWENRKTLGAVSLQKTRRTKEYTLLEQPPVPSPCIKLKSHQNSYVFFR